MEKDQINIIYAPRFIMPIKNEMWRCRFIKTENSSI